MANAKSVAGGWTVVKEVRVPLGHLYEGLADVEVCRHARDGLVRAKATLPSNGSATPTNFGTQVKSAQNPDGQVVVHLADDLSRVARREMGLLQKKER